MPVLGGRPVLYRFLAKYEAEWDKTSMFIDSKITVHLFIREVNALAVSISIYSPKLLDLSGKTGFIYSTTSRVFHRGP